MKEKKRIVVLFVTLCMFIMNVGTVCANDDITVSLDDEILFFDVPPQIIDGRTLVPMRKIFEALGATVTWDEASRTVTGKKDDITINMSIDSNILFKNSVPKVLDVAPLIIDGRTLVPARAIAESFDCSVDWIAENRTVKIETNRMYDKSRNILSASEIADKLSSAVFYIEVYDESYEPLGSGSGFFISSDGVAVTNYHVIEDSCSAIITMVNGDKFNVNSIIAYDENLDIAILRINKISTEGKNISYFPSVTIADSNDIKAGQTIYALGSPVGLQNTISNGIISNTERIMGDETFIQITAPISHGSSGGALVNEYGEVLGITSAGIDEAQNIGFAIPINTIKIFDLNATGISYEEFADNNSSFTLALYPEVIELEIGETQNIYVYAEGKSDEWSIYYHTEQDDVVACKWGDWLEEDDAICPLYITGLNAGEAIVTVYSDVDFKGKDVLIRVNYPPIEFYPSSVTNVPTYTSITGINLIRCNEYERNNIYSYNYYDVEDVINYFEFLTANGFERYDTVINEEELQYYYLTPENKLISVSIQYKWNEVWILVPKY